MESTNRKRSVLVYRRRTSICLEDSFWYSLHAIVQIENTTVTDFVEKVASQRNSLNLSSSLRIAVLEYFQTLAASSIAIRSELDPGILAGKADARRSEIDNEEALARVTSFWKRIKRRRNAFAAAALQPDMIANNATAGAPEKLVAREGLEPPTPGL